MKIALVAGFFLPDFGYQEVYLARALSRLGHTVRVFASTTRPPHYQKIVTENFPAGLTRDDQYNYEIYRLKPTIKIKGKIITPQLMGVINDFKPDLVFVIALAQMFALPLFQKSFSLNNRIVVFFGDSNGYSRSDNFLQNILTILYLGSFKILKTYLYRKALKHCNRIVFNHPETEDLFRSFVGKKNVDLLMSKKLNLNLGYDPDEFYFNMNDRSMIREKYGIADDEILMITTTVVRKGKKLEEIISAITGLKEKGLPVKYMLAGFRNDEYSNELLKFIEQNDKNHIIIPFQMLKHHEIRQLYCGSDIGIWQKATISIQEGMGTGLTVIIENQPIVTHLIQEGFNGWSFNENNLGETIEKAVKEMYLKNYEERVSFRENIVKLNSEKLSYDKITGKILSSVSA